MVQKGQNISVEIDPKAASILVLSMQGPNKNRIVNYLNTTVHTLIKTQLDRKNQFATNTIEFIDSTLVSMGNQLKETGDELTSFNKRNNIVEIEKAEKTLPVSS